MCVVRCIPIMMEIDYSFHNLNCLLPKFWYSYFLSWEVRD